MKKRDLTIKNKPRKNKQRNTKTRKNKIVGGILGDNNLAKLYYKNKQINCFVCGNGDFQKRNSTMNKSKTNQAIFNLFGSSEASSVNDISLYSYFCNECGYAFIVRDPKLKENGTYNNLIVSNP
jgi:hypothetical protein